MNLIVSSKQLYQKLVNAIRVINNKNTLPILDCFLIGLKGNVLNIAATDGEIRLSTKLEVTEADGSGIICINAKQITEALKELPEQPLKIEIDNETKAVTIHYHNGKYDFVGQDAESYPQPKGLDELVKQELIVSADVLLNGVNRTLFAAANDELRPIMNGVYFDITKDNVTFVASDGHKLVCLRNTDTMGKDRASFVLPSKAANVIKKLLEKQTDSVKIKFDLNQAILELSDCLISCRFIEGRYPNYSSVIPQNNPYKVMLSKDALIAIIKRISVFANQASNMVKFDLVDNALTVSSQDIDFSTSAEESYEVFYQGEPMQIGFKASFLLELLSTIQSNEIEIQLSDPSKAALIVPVQNSFGWNSTSLLMPMQLND